MSEQKKTEITVRSNITAKASPDLEKIRPKSTAGLSEEELIERNVVGKFEEEDEDEEQQTEL